MKNQKTEQKQRYGLLTAITLITGTVIGSGIFFKAPKVLDATNGSVPLGILMFALAALAIIFGSLAIGQIAARTDKPGGIMTYYEEFISPRVACSYGWFEVFIHYPAIIAVLSWIAGVYFCTLFNIEGSLLLQCGIGTAWILICFAFNALSRKGGGYFQNASTFIKMIPLLLVAIFGLILGDPITALKARPLASNSASGLLAAVGPLCFAYDGWHVATFVQADIKNPKRNMPLALFLTPLVITIVYICYFWGMSSILGPQRVMELGDAHVAVAMEKILGALGGRVFFIFVIRCFGDRHHVELPAVSAALLRRVPSVEAEGDQEPVHGTFRSRTCCARVGHRNSRRTAESAVHLVSAHLCCDAADRVLLLRQAQRRHSLRLRNITPPCCVIQKTACLFSAYKPNLLSTLVPHKAQDRPKAVLCFLSL